MNQESNLILNQPFIREDLTNKEREALDELVKISQSYKISFEDFKDVKWLSHGIERDKKALEQRKREMNDKTERGVLLEKLLISKMEDYGWFGESAYICPTTEFDDIMNGVDFVVEFEKNNKIIYLAVDCTVSDQRDIIFDKVLKTQKNIEKGKLSEIKYFQSEKEITKEGDFVKKTLRMVPRVIVSVDKDKLKEFCKNYSEEKDSANSYLQIFILEEIKLQLNYQIDQIQDNEIEIEEPDSDRKKNRILGVLKETEEYISEILEKKRRSDSIDTEAADRAIRNSKIFDYFS